MNNLKLHDHLGDVGIDGKTISSVCVTIDGVFIGEWIYWPLIHATQSYKQSQRHRYVSIYGSTDLYLDLGHFFSFLILYTVGRTPLTGD
jgi:hypothetical protein